MKKKILILTAAVVIIGAVSGYAFAGSRARVEANLVFHSATDDRVVLEIKNKGMGAMKIHEEGYYIDHTGSAGSWNCSCGNTTTVAPGQRKYVEFKISQPVTHGDKSVLCFFFKYEGFWYLCKVGEEYGTQIYKNH